MTRSEVRVPHRPPRKEFMESVEIEKSIGSEKGWTLTTLGQLRLFRQDIEHLYIEQNPGARLEDVDSATDTAIFDCASLFLNFINKRSDGFGYSKRFPNGSELSLAINLGNLED